MIKEFLLRLGVISKRIDGSTHWPVYWTRPGMIWYLIKHGPRFYVFRNRDSQPWWKDRWLPWRWGFVKVRRPDPNAADPYEYNLYSEVC